MVRFSRFTAALALALPLAARALCTSDGVAPPQVLLERFLSADCADCWRDPRTPDAAPGTLVLDWVLPGRQGEDAPLSAVARRDGLERLAALGLPAPEADSARTLRRAAGPAGLRVAQGPAFNDYLGATITLQAGARAGVDAWLLLVEALPAGTEGSPVARHLVRNVFRPEWGAPGAARRSETRSMQIHEGVNPDRLRLVGVVQDRRGRLLALAMTECG